MPTGSLYSLRNFPKAGVAAHPVLAAVAVGLAGVVIGAALGLALVELIHWLSAGEPIVALQPQVAFTTGIRALFRLS
ncbi:hypothetical protein ABEG18_25625 [Alsobacter sp. KACC 23698]|uniref:Chloride channel protein n=1 Tax=Alsobacter sp. KACC 23698 TaxID=3149229 RepID=A0AAU7JFV8_9HYPH